LSSNFFSPRFEKYFLLERKGVKDKVYKYVQELFLQKEANEILKG